MSRRLSLVVALSLLGMGGLSLPPVASAETPLTRATVQTLRNQVQLILKNRVTRAAQKADTMTPGDSLATARRSFAELRFNDNSLARIGERALFQFVPRTRNFYLGNGTALLLIPPGQGRTNIRTPNAAAGIRGSALFVRYNEDTNTTIVGALTNSRIEVSNNQNPQAQTLKAGQMAVIVQNQIVQVYNFDLNTFYQTSELVKDLDLPLRNATPSADPGIAAVQAETAQAVREQAPLIGQVFENPAFVSLSPAPGLQTAVTPTPANQITLTPSGLDLSTARQTLVVSPAAQAFTATRESIQPGVATPPAQLSIPNGATVNVAVPSPVPPVIALPLPDLNVTIGGVAPTESIVTSPTLPTPPVPATPPPITRPEIVEPTLPIPVVVTPPPPAAAQPTPAPVVVTSPPTPTPIPQTPNPAPAPRPDPVTPPQPSPAPAPQAPVRPEPAAPVVVTPPPTPTPIPQAPIQPAPVAPVVTPPQPSPAPAPRPDPVTPPRPSPAPVIVTPPGNPTPAPQAPIVSPAPRPDPVTTPTPVVQPAPTPISPVTDIPAIQTPIVPPPTVVTPVPTTLDIQTGTPVPIQPGIGSGAASP